MTTTPTYPQELLAQTAWLQRLTRELVRNAHTAADLAQDTLAAALEQPRPNRANLRTWLERIARNIAAGRARSHFRRLRREREFAASSETGEESSAIDMLARFEMHRSVVSAVRNLREPLRTTLLLRFWEDLPPREISQRMGTPVETVRTRIKRGLHELRGSLDDRHGQRDAWSIPLLALAKERGATLAPASFRTATIGILMQTKTLAIAAIAIVGALAVFAWQKSSASFANSTSPPQIAATQAEARATEVEAKQALGSRSPPPPTPQPAATAERTLATGATSAPKAWLTGTVRDAFGATIADVEVALLTGSQADTYGHHVRPRPTGRALQVLRTRWALWKISDNGWMHNEAILGELFGTALVARTDAAGSFQFRRDAVLRDMVLAIWSPEVGLRFQTVVDPQSPQHIACEAWPRIRGQVGSSSGVLQEPVAITVDYGVRGGRVLQFRTEATGNYVTPPMPPGEHTLGFRLVGHHGKNQQLDLRDDVVLATELDGLQPLRLRLVDAAGLLLDRQRFAHRGWDAAELRFLLLRKDAQTEPELSAMLRTQPKLQYSPTDGTLTGTVEDPQALVLSVWRDREWVAATRLADHRVRQAALDVPNPKPSATLEVDIATDATTPPTEIQLQLGTRVGLGGYSFKPAAEANGPQQRFQLKVPGFLRGQSARLVVTARGFATQFVEVAVPQDGDPKPLRLTLAAANLTLTGSIVDQDGRPIVGARVKIATVDGRAFRSLPDTIRQTDERGVFEFADLAAGEVRLFASGREFASTSTVAVAGATEAVAIHVEPGTERTLDLGAAGDQSLALRVLDIHGAPLMDDRLFGAMHGRTTRMRLTAQAHKVEGWHVRASQPAVTIDLR
ncbi:MAG: sigma-70 family RNA polymerase sigma factor [Planctomycetota bacterium]